MSEKKHFGQKNEQNFNLVPPPPSNYFLVILELPPTMELPPLLEVAPTILRNNKRVGSII